MVEVAVGLVLAWVMAKARRAASRADGLVDTALDAAVDRVGELVLGRLDTDTAVQQLQIEADETGEISQRTRNRVQLALEEVVESDAGFAERLAAAIAEVDKASGAVAPGGVAISGGVNVKDSGVAFGVVTGGSVSVKQTGTDPH